MEYNVLESRGSCRSNTPCFEGVFSVVSIKGFVAGQEARVCNYPKESAQLESKWPEIVHQADVLYRV